MRVGVGARRRGGDVAVAGQSGGGWIKEMALNFLFPCPQRLESCPGGAQSSVEKGANRGSASRVGSLSWTEQMLGATGLEEKKKNAPLKPIEGAGEAANGRRRPVLGGSKLQPLAGLRAYQVRLPLLPPVTAIGHMGDSTCEFWWGR